MYAKYKHIQTGSATTRKIDLCKRVGALGEDGKKFTVPYFSIDQEGVDKLEGLVEEITETNELNRTLNIEPVACATHRDPREIKLHFAKWTIIFSQGRKLTGIYFCMWAHEIKIKPEPQTGYAST